VRHDHVINAILALFTIGLMLGVILYVLVHQ
jgi:hypothetical protein